MHAYDLLKCATMLKTAAPTAAPAASGLSQPDLQALNVAMANSPMPGGGPHVSPGRMAGGGAALGALLGGGVAAGGRGIANLFRDEEEDKPILPAALMGAGVGGLGGAGLGALYGQGANQLSGDLDNMLGDRSAEGAEDYPALLDGIRSQEGASTVGPNEDAGDISGGVFDSNEAASGDAESNLKDKDTQQHGEQIPNTGPSYGSELADPSVAGSSKGIGKRTLSPLKQVELGLDPGEDALTQAIKELIERTTAQ